MTQVKTTEKIIIVDGEKTIEKTEYYEVSKVEVDEMFRKAEKGQDVEKLKDDLIQKSTW